VAGLAEKWQVSANGKEITFHLRKGVKFHSNEFFKPSRDLNAEDVIFSFNRMRLQEHPYHKVSGGDYKLFKSMEMHKLIKDIQSSGPYEVKFVLTRPEATIMANLAMEFASIFSAEYAQKLLQEKRPQHLDQKPIGTGPFQFREYTKDAQAKFVAHADYYRGRPRADELIFDIAVDPQIRVQNLKAKKCHLTSNVRPDSLADLRADKNIRIMSQPGLNIFYLAFNTRKAPYDQLEFRRAVHHAINREQIVKEVFGGFAQVAKNPIPPTLWSYDRKIQDLDYNVEKAKVALAASKLPANFKIQLSYMPVTRPYNPDGLRVAQLMQKDLEVLGLKIELVTKEWPDYLRSAYEGQFDLLQIGWTSDNGDPDNFLNTLLSCSGAESGSNYSRWCNKDYSHSVARARTTTDIRKRTVFYEKAQRIFKAEIPWVTLAHAQIYKAMLKEVEGYKTNPLGHDHFDEVRLKSWKD
jgi:dipeptide transport system substrate-binding protein